MDQELIGKIIKENRIKNNLTQADLADKLGVTYQAVSKWENGKNIPDVALLTEICKLFNLDINELLGNKKIKSNNNKYIFLLIGLIIMILISTILFVKINNKDNFSMKEIKSRCDAYDISGVVAYSKAKSSIYISSINYCGDKDETKYKTITCNLYEELNNKITKIKSCQKNHDITLEEYFKNIKINVDNYKSMCNKFNTAKLYLEVETSNGNGVDIHKIPLKLENNCN